MRKIGWIIWRERVWLSWLWISEVWCFWVVVVWQVADGFAVVGWRLIDFSWVVVSRLFCLFVRECCYWVCLIFPDWLLFSFKLRRSWSWFPIWLRFIWCSFVLFPLLRIICCLGLGILESLKLFVIVVWSIVWKYFGFAAVRPPVYFWNVLYCVCWFEQWSRRSRDWVLRSDSFYRIRRRSRCILFWWADRIFYVRVGCFRVRWCRGCQWNTVRRRCGWCFWCWCGSESWCASWWTAPDLTECVRWRGRTIFWRLISRSLSNSFFDNIYLADWLLWVEDGLGENLWFVFFVDNFVCFAFG